MAEERKKPKIDLKTRIPSKTVKGLAPVPGGAIPPPPGAVPAPPPDLLGRRSMPPQVTVDPNDPLGAATVVGGHSKQQVIVVEAASHEGVAAASKRGMFYAIVAVVLVAGGGLGFAMGTATTKGGIASQAKVDARELSEKVNKTNEALTKFDDSLKGAINEVENKGYIEQSTIEAVKGFQSPLSANDLKTRQIAYFGEDVAQKVYTYFAKVAYIEELKAALTKGNNLENSSVQLKALALPKGQVKYGVTISPKPSDAKEPQITGASIIDLGAPMDLRPAIDAKTNKLKTKTGELDVWSGKGEFVGADKSYLSAIDSKDWMKACPVYPQAIGYIKQGLQEIVVAIEGSGDDPGTLKPGKDLSDKLKSLAK